METKSGLKFDEIKKYIGEHLKTAMGISHFDINYAKHEENKWLVNVEWKEAVGTGILQMGQTVKQTALFALDDRTGEILEFQKGKWWSF